MATLVQQWARQYIQDIERRPAPHTRARIRVYLFEGLDKFQMATMVEGIPMLLHLSVFLFFGGLVEFLSSVNFVIARFTLGLVVACGALYAIATLLPALICNCPYRTPLSTIAWQTMQTLRLALFFKKTGSFVMVHGSMVMIRGSMAQGGQTLATESPKRNVRDISALQFTLESLNEDSELEPCLEGIPSFMESSTIADGGALITELLLYKIIQLIGRIGNVLEKRILSRNRKTALKHKSHKSTPGTRTLPVLTAGIFEPNNITTWSPPLLY